MKVIIDGVEYFPGVIRVGTRVRIRSVSNPDYTVGQGVLGMTGYIVDNHSCDLPTRVRVLFSDNNTSWSFNKEDLEVLDAFA